MEAKEIDFPYVQSKDQVEGQLNALAGGIMDLVDVPDPNHSATVEPKEEAVEEPVEEPTPEPEPEDKYKIKWQGQEREVTQAELLDLAQKGFDYTQKTQALAQERDQLAGLAGLQKLLQSDPVKARKIAEVIAGTTQPEPKKFEDPIDQLKWETKQEALAEIRQELQQTAAPLYHQQMLNEVRMQVQADPDYQAVHGQIIEMVKGQPPALQAAMYRQLDQNPQVYMEAFQHFKAKLKEAPAKPTPVKRETKAPIVESGGLARPEVQSKERTAQLSKQKAQALRSGDPMEVAKWLQSSGAIEHLY